MLKMKGKSEQKTEGERTKRGKERGRRHPPLGSSLPLAKAAGELLQPVAAFTWSGVGQTFVCI